jgi:hypothetical protein
MKTFKDSKETSWDISVTVGSLKRVKDILGIDIIDEASQKENIFIKISEDPIKLCNILYVLCKNQADERKITDEQFGELMGGDAIEQATNCFIEELIDFFPSAKRPAFRKMTKKIEEITNKGINYMTEYLDSPELEKKVMDQIKSESGI